MRLIFDHPGWVGYNRVEWGGRQLGVIELATPKNNPGEVILTWIDPPTGGRSGWGFGYRATINHQGFAWEGHPAGRPTVEISVTADELQPAELEHRLK